MVRIVEARKAGRKDAGACKLYTQILNILQSTIGTKLQIT